MKVPIIEVTGPTWAKMAKDMSCIPYSNGFWPHSGRYVPADFKYGEYSKPVQLAEAIEICNDMIMNESLSNRDVAVIHVLPSMHDFFSPLYCGLYWDFYWFDTKDNDIRRERRNKIVYETHIRKMHQYKNRILWRIDKSLFYLIGEKIRQDGCIFPDLRDMYDIGYEDIPF